MNHRDGNGHLWLSPPFVPLTRIFRSDVERGEWKIVRFSMTPEQVRAASIISILNFEGGETRYLMAGDYVKLVNGRTIVMSDTGMERISNYEFIKQAHGHVLMAGLGLGFSLVPLLRNKEVERVVVVEKSEDVMELVLPSLMRFLGNVRTRGRLLFVHSDIYDFVPSQQYDCVWMDIWSEIGAEAWDEMKRLRRQFRKHVKDGGWIRGWREGYAKQEAAEMRRVERAITGGMK